jgi:hypothetical protein
MSKVIKLPSGETVTIKDASTLKQGERKKIMLIAGSDENAVSVGLKIVDALLAILVEEWSFELMLPSVKVAILDELSIADYDVLAEEAQKAQSVIWPKFDDNEEVNSPKDN